VSDARCRPASLDELHLAWARVPNTAGHGGFDKALANPATRFLLERMVLLRRKKHERRFR